MLKYFKAEVAELVDAYGLGPYALGLASSNLALSTQISNRDKIVK